MKTYYSYPNFLPLEHCKRLIKRAKTSKLYQQDAILNNEGLQVGSYRTSQSFALIDTKLLQYLAKNLRVEQHRMERPLLIRYYEGGEFKPHLDFHIEGTEDYHQRIQYGGQRTLTFVFYLNDNFEGGELYFDCINETVKPTAGMLAIVVNQWLDGTMNWNSSHASLPLKKGIKYILLVNYTGSYDRNHLEYVALKHQTTA